MEKQIENLSEVNNDLKIRVLEEERYKRRWCLRIKGLKENSNERIREDVIQLLGKITPEFASNMEEAVDVVHRVGRKETGRSREVIILFTPQIGAGRSMEENQVVSSVQRSWHPFCRRPDERKYPANTERCEDVAS